MPRDCSCAANGDPLASVRVDDLYCAQCGGRTAWLVSDHLLRNPDPTRFKLDPSTEGRLLWAYAGDHGCGLTLDYRGTRDDHAGVEGRPASVDQATIKVRTGRLALRAEPSLRDENRSVHLEFVPEQRTIEDYGDEWWEQKDLLPDGGLLCTLSLIGNFGHEEFGLLIFQTPRFEVELLEENGTPIRAVRPDQDPSIDRAWAVSRRGEHQLVARISCGNGYVHLAPPEDDVGPAGNPDVTVPEGFVVALENAGRDDPVLGPGHPPCTLRLRFDSSSDAWNQDALQTVAAQFHLAVLGGGLDPVAVPLFLEPRGDIGFSRQSGRFVELTEFRVDELYYGERRQTQADGDLVLPAHVWAWNRGEKPLRNVSVDCETAADSRLPGVSWLQVERLEGNAARPADESVSLGDGKRFAIRVTIDLRRVDSVRHPRIAPLRGKVLVQSEGDERPPWELPVVVQSVRARPAMGPLAIDFGNTNTYAAIVGRQGPVPVLGDADPENFTTAIFLEGRPDEDLSNVTIGPEAVALGKQRPRDLVCRLKRWMLDDDQRWAEPGLVRARGGPDGDLGRPDLVRWFLRKLLVECETALRQTVTRAAFSYPAKYGPTARQRFHAIIKELEAEQRARFGHDHPTIEFADVATWDASPDEASAVTLAYALDDDHRRDTIGDHQRFLLASFDFGGGSIDTALLRFTREGGPHLSRFHSTHLGLGGDERFGGDNVTTAVAQLLRQKFRDLTGLSGFQAEARSGAAAAVSDAATNYQHLWDLADDVKRSLCGAPVDLETRAAEFLGRIRVAVADADTDPSGPPPLDAVKAPLLDRIKQVTLDDVYRQKVVSDDRRDTTPPYTVDDRVGQCVKELQRFVAKAREDERARRGPDDHRPDDPLFIVLAGAACRLPLVRERIGEAFKEAHILGDPTREPGAQPKCKVAFGLAQFLDRLANVPRTVAGLSRAGHYTHGPIVLRTGQYRVVEWVPTCRPLKSEEWYALADVELSACFQGGRVVRVYHGGYEPEELGHFDLSGPAGEEVEGLTRELPATIDRDLPSVLSIQVREGEDDLRLKVRLGDEEYGAWRLVARRSGPAVARSEADP